MGIARRSTRPPPASSTAPAAADTGIDMLTHIVALIDADGCISLGEMSPVECAAVSTDGHQALAMLQRRHGEPLRALLTAGLSWRSPTDA